MEINRSCSLDIVLGLGFLGRKGERVNGMFPVSYYLSVEFVGSADVTGALGWLPTWGQPCHTVNVSTKNAGIEHPSGFAEEVFRVNVPPIKPFSLLAK